jgi:AMMECR1 domain-containing protein
VLSPLRRVLDVQQIKVGQHGLLMKNGAYEGLLLPQVPVEEKWDRQKFLEETCAKAGMRSNCWKDENTDIFMFTAVVFGENQAASASCPDLHLRLQAYPRGQEGRRQIDRRTESHAVFQKPNTGMR